MTPVSRRRFLGGLVAATTLAASRRGHAAALSFGPASFDVTATSALVWLRVSTTAHVRVEYGTRPDFDGAAVSTPVQVTGATDHTVAIDLVGLTPDTEYFYRGVVSAGDAAPVGGDAGRFRTAPVAPREFSFGWSGDMEAAHRPFAILDHVTRRRPDFFLMVGDTMYADVPKAEFVPSLAHYRSKHRENREDAPLQRLLATTPVFAIWDDHEVHNNFDRTHPALAGGRQAFREYWPVRGADALYRRFAWTPAVEVFILDCRSDRSPMSEADGPAKTMLGVAQKRWLKEALARSPATFKFVVSSVPFLPRSRPDSWTGYGTERGEILDFIRRERIRNVVVLSADMHMALDEEENGVLEFVAGPIGTEPHCRGGIARRWRADRGGRLYVCDSVNVGMITVRPHAAPPHAEMQLIDATGAARYRRIVRAS